MEAYSTPGRSLPLWYSPRRNPERVSYPGGLWWFICTSRENDFSEQQQIEHNIVIRMLNWLFSVKDFVGFRTVRLSDSNSIRSRYQEEISSKHRSRKLGDHHEQRQGVEGKDWRIWRWRHGEVLFRHLCRIYPGRRQRFSWNEHVRTDTPYYITSDASGSIRPVRPVAQ